MSEENKNVENGADGQSSETAVNDAFIQEEEIKPKKPRTVTLSSFICSAVALVLAAVMLTYTVCSGIYQKKLAEATVNGAQTVTFEPEGKYDALEMLEWFFENYSFEELDDEKQRTAVMKAFIEATGDKYAEYYTEAEYLEFMAAVAGESVGIGISVLNDFVNVNGVEYNTIKVLKIFKDSPAANSELKIGDRIAWIGVGEDATYIGDVGYTAAVNMLRGEAGTKAEFVVLRERENGEFFTVEISMTRAKYEIESVSGKVIDGTDIGYVAIDSFDITTPRQFSETMDQLIQKGCTRFIYDLRNNPGGELTSIVSTLSFFLEKDDTIITMEAVNGAKQVFKVAAADYTDTEYEPCTVTEKDIGKYAEYEMAVLCNENTASAAELFTANFRDHALGKVVGTTTYGKGVAQSTISLAQFGINGYLKYTSKLYYPPCGENYDGEGIVPDFTVPLSDEAKQYSFYELPIEKDDQLQKAIECLDQ